jgi:hypothetical protein
MKFILTVGSSKLILDHDKLSKLIEIIDGSETVKENWVGKAKSESGYVTVLDKPKLADLISLTVMSQIEYDALVTFTEVHKQQED